MTSPPPNVFDSGAQMFLAPDEAAAFADSQSPSAAAEIQVLTDGENQPEQRTGPHRASGETNSGATGDSELTRSARPSDAISLFELCIRGFDQDKFLFDIGCIPDDFDKYMALMEALTDNDEPPLFLQRTA